MSKYKANTITFLCGLLGLIAYACVDIFVKKVESDYAVVATLIERIRTLEGDEVAYNNNLEREEITIGYRNFTQQEPKGIREITEDLFSRKLQLVRKCSRLQLIGSIFLIEGGVGIILGIVMMLRSFKGKQVSESKTPLCACKEHDPVAPARAVTKEVIIAAPLKDSPCPKVKKTNIAIIDKDETSRNLAGVMLKKLGYATQVITSKGEFQKSLEVRSIDAVLVSWESRDILGTLQDGEIRVIYTTNGGHIKGHKHVLAKPFTSYDIKRELTTI